MRFGYREICLAHDPGPQHPERPARLRAIRERLGGMPDVEYVEAPDVDEALLRRVHDPEYVESVKDFCAGGGGNWSVDTAAVEATWDAALASAGLAVWAAEAALDQGELVGSATPFSLGRPPGHHAVADDAMGFCFFDNVVVAAEAVLSADADRVAIVDWDVHHGNGTQDLCYDRGDVFYASIHQSPLYPGTGQVAETGSGDGAMATLNVPVPPGSDAVDYLAAVDEVIAPSIREYDPDLLLVSAGFDAHEADAISSVALTTGAFALLGDRVRTLASDCGAGLGFVLEGGYELDALADSVAAVNGMFADRSDAGGAGTSGDALPPEPDGEVSDEVRATIDALLDQGFGSK